MNYNKLFLISISLIYSANTFSNTDGLPPRVGNQIESNQEINGSDNNLNSKKRNYVERKVYSLLENHPVEFLLRTQTNFRIYVQNLQPKRSSTDTQFLIAAPIFDEMRALSTKNSNSKDLTKQSSDELNLKEYSIEEQRNMVSYLKTEKEKIINLSKKVKSTYHRENLEKLDMAIHEFIESIQRNIDSDNKESSGITIRRNEQIQRSVFDSILNMYPVTPSDLVEMDVSYDDRFSTLYSKTTQTATELADTKTELAELDETVKQHEEDIEEQGKDITQVKQTADENKKHVDKYLVNNFQVSGESRNLINHLGALYLENKSNSLAISSLRNDFEHFKDETNNRFYKVEKRANQGIASVAAMSNLPFNDAATFSTAMGIGNYRNATAFAWGMQYRINENVKVKASTAWNDANNWVSAGGIGISW
ncbi:YadA-like family protein [Proteus mirabilis]|uniref:YadA-like family protein n=1 Tax=Proteus mirabilis TaxID=584 RepID=UPI0029BFBB5A|nr:YadA-like family protein [Proteus mirabilis]MDX4949418.1 YadA-like family protein [Proteus mirabilis]